jgi:hypothetical protein
MPPATPRSTSFPAELLDDTPLIDSADGFLVVVDKLIVYISKVIDAAFTYEQLRTSFAGQGLRPLIISLSDNCHHTAIVAALLAARYHFTSIESDGSGVHESRGLAAELVAWQFLTFLSEKELLEYLLWELPKADRSGTQPSTPLIHPAANPVNGDGAVSEDDEMSPLLQADRTGLDNDHRRAFEGPGLTGTQQSALRNQSIEELSNDLAGLSALEIALVCDAKKFISSQPVQRVVTDIWNGDIVFWESLSVQAVKKAIPSSKRVRDPFIRLRVPKYQKAFQVIFFLLVSPTILVAMVS